MPKSKLYKLTGQNDRTRNNTVWGEGVTIRKTPCKNPRMYSGDMVYAYRNPTLAYLLNPIHANIENPKIWEAEGEIANSTWGKVGCFALTTVRKAAAPSWVGGDRENLVRIAFAVLCAEAVLPLYEDRFPSDKRAREAIGAARNYLDNPGAADAAWAAAKAARAAAEAAQAAAGAADAAWAAAKAAARAAARAAVEAAQAAAWAAARAAQAAWAADAAVWTQAAARAAAWAAADGAADAAWAAARAVTEIDFCLIADKAVEMIMEKIEA